MPNIINRIGKYRTGEWYKRDVSNITKITVHHSAIPLKNYGDNDDGLLKFFQQIHANKGWPGLSYHFVITQSGKIYQTNDYNEVTWHDSHNYDSLGVCVNGYFHPEVNDKPTEKQLESLDWLLDHLCTEHPEFPADQDDVVGHRERSPTACPGNLLFPYVVEYREKNGGVDWGSEETTETTENTDCENKIIELEKELDEMRASRNRWKADYEKLAKETAAEIATKNKNIEDLSKLLAEKNITITELSGQITDITADYNRVADDKARLEEGMKTLETEINRLSGIVERLEGQLEQGKQLCDYSRKERFSSLFTC